MSDGIRFRDCACPGTPHREEGDIAFLRPHLDFVTGAMANRIIVENLGTSERLDETLGPLYLERAFAGWNLLDADGEAVPFDGGELLALPYAQASILAEAADTKFSVGVMDPFMKRIASLSRNGRTGKNSSTSATRKSQRRPRSRSARSSPNGSVGSRP